MNDHAPSELKMVDAVTCSRLGIRASTGFFKNGSRDKTRFEDFMWGNQKQLRCTQERYESPYEDTCITITDFFLLTFEFHYVLASDELTSPISNSKKYRNINLESDEEQEDDRYVRKL